MSNALDTFIAGNTLPKLHVTIRDRKTKLVVQLATVYTATIAWSIDGAATVSQAAVVLSGASDGIVEYQFLAGELVAGTMQVQVTLTEIATGLTTTTLNEIKRVIGASL